MTLEALKYFMSREDYGFACTTGVYGCVCDNDARQQNLDCINWENCNSPKLLERESLENVLEHFPEFEKEIENGAKIYTIDEYDEASWRETYYISICL
ncbi:MAG: hypothetical protein HDS35_09875 [Bacteroides sp.]|nr:hypothetical protein [Bacteroides sp.]